MVVYLAQYQLVPMARLTELLDDLLGVRISQGTVNNMLRRCHGSLEVFEGARARGDQERPGGPLRRVRGYGSGASCTGCTWPARRW